MPAPQAGRKPGALLDRHAGQRDPIHGERPSLTCPDCWQVFTAYYYRMHRGLSDNERCPSIPNNTKEVG